MCFPSVPALMRTREIRPKTAGRESVAVLGIGPGIIMSIFRLHPLLPRIQQISFCGCCCPRVFFCWWSGTQFRSSLREVNCFNSLTLNCTFSIIFTHSPARPISVLRPPTVDRTFCGDNKAICISLSTQISTCCFQDYSPCIWLENWAFRFWVFADSSTERSCQRTL